MLKNLKNLTTLHNLLKTPTKVQMAALTEEMLLEMTDEEYTAYQESQDRIARLRAEKKSAQARKVKVENMVEKLTAGLDQSKIWVVKTQEDGSEKKSYQKGSVSTPYLLEMLGKAYSKIAELEIQKETAPPVKTSTKSAGGGKKKAKAPKVPAQTIAKNTIEKMGFVDGMCSACLWKSPDGKWVNINISQCQDDAGVNGLCSKHNLEMENFGVLRCGSCGPDNTTFSAKMLGNLMYPEYIAKVSKNHRGLVEKLITKYGFTAPSPDEPAVAE